MFVPNSQKHRIINALFIRFKRIADTQSLYNEMEHLKLAQNGYNSREIKKIENAKARAKQIKFEIRIIITKKSLN